MGYSVESNRIMQCTINILENPHTVMILTTIEDTIRYLNILNRCAVKETWCITRF